MQKLNLPEFSFNVKNKDDKTHIFDPVRRRFVSLTPEEWVRQNFMAWLIQHKNYPSGLIAVEKEIIYNNLKKRYDIVVFNKAHAPEVIIECKAPHINITQNVFDQIAVYNMKMKVRYLMVTNGMEHFCCTVDFEKKNYSFLETIPDYTDLMGNH